MTPRILPPGLIVSCQAEGDSPFNAPVFIAAFARAAEMGGAVAVRVCGAENVAAVRRAVHIPVIGLTKSAYPDGSVLITPGQEDVAALIGAGADVVAMDGTARRRATGWSGTDTLGGVVRAFAAPVMADVATLEEGLAAAAAGAAYVGTTLSGYTPDTQARDDGEPDFGLLEGLAARLPGRVIMEGRIWTPAQAAEALRRGAHAVVVGTAITRPVEIVRRFAAALS